jgi:NAD+ kinase
LKKLAVVLNLDKPEVVAKFGDIEAWAKKNSIGLRLFSSDAQALGRKELTLKEGEIEQVEIVLVLGGDGTILKAARLLKGKNIPLLGINFGKVGFISEVEESNIEEALEKVVKSEYQIEERMMLKVKVNVEGFGEPLLALNEAVIGRGGRPRPIELAIEVNEQAFSSLLADGLIVATPTGSTAYSFSAGGPVVSSLAQLILVTPICPYSSFNRSLILSSGEGLSVKLLSGEDVELAIDGLKVADLKPGYQVIFQAASEVISLVKLDKRNFFQLFKKKLSGREGD